MTGLLSLGNFGIAWLASGFGMTAADAVSWSERLMRFGLGAQVFTIALVGAMILLEVPGKSAMQQLFLAWFSVPTRSVWR